jgi:hypothetical protein
MRKQIFQNPKTKFGRFVVGWALVIGGILGFLPVLGFWMIPLGLLVLSNDYAFARRWRRKLQIWAGNRQKKRENKNGKVSEFED